MLSSKVSEIQGASSVAVNVSASADGIQSVKRSTTCALALATEQWRGFAYRPYIDLLLAALH